MDKGYDESAASFYWGLHIPKARIRYDDLSKIQNCRELVMDQVQDWAPELYVVTCSIARHTLVYCATSLLSY